MTKCPNCNNDVKAPWNRAMFQCPGCKKYIHFGFYGGAGAGETIKIFFLSFVPMALVLLLFYIIRPDDARERHQPMFGFSLLACVMLAGLLSFYLLRRFAMNLTIAIEHYRKYFYERKTRFFELKKCPQCQQELKLPRFNGLQFISKHHPLICSQCESLLIPAPGQRRNMFLLVFTCILIFVGAYIALVDTIVATNNNNLLWLVLAVPVLYVIVIFSITRSYARTLRLVLQT